MVANNLARSLTSTAVVSKSWVSDGDRLQRLYAILHEHCLPWKKSSTRE